MDGDESRDRNRYSQFVPVSEAAQDPWKLDIGPFIIQFESKTHSFRLKTQKKEA